MEISNNSDLILVLRLEDIKGVPMRVDETSYIKIYVWTSDPSKVLVFNRRDILTDGDFDRIPIDRKYLDQLAAGVLQYTYDYGIINDDFSGTDETYNKVKTVTTDIYFRNDTCCEDITAVNPVTFETIEDIYDKLDKEADIRESADRKLKGITDELEAGVQRNAGNIEAEYLRAKTAETALDNRLDTVELTVEQIRGDESQIGSIAHAIRESKNYTDNEIVKVANGYAKKSELTAVEAKIPKVDHNLSAYHNDCGYISNTDIFNNYYNKSVIDGKFNMVDVESIARKDEVTVVKDEDGNIIHEMVIDTAPDYYTKNEVDNKLTLFETIEGASEKYQPIGNYLTEHQSLDDYYTKSEVNTVISETKEEINGKIDEKIGDIDFSSFETIEGAAAKYQPIGNYLTEHQSLENYYTKSEIDTSVNNLVDEKIGDIDFSSFETVEGAAAKYQPIGDYITSDSLLDKQMIWFGSEEDAPALENRNSQTLYIII